MQDKPTQPMAGPATAASAISSPTGHGRSERARATESHIDAINQAFELFRLNYHNQYFAAFPDVQTLNMAKRLWLDALSRFSPEAILQGARRVIEASDFLPTVHKMIVACEGDNQSHGLPDVHAAYVEACNAASPKIEQRWSHPAVYLAGQAADWYFLSSQPEKAAYPVFAQHYKALCEQVRAGNTLRLPERKALPETLETPLSSAENRERLASLRKALDI